MPYIILDFGFYKTEFCRQLFFVIPAGTVHDAHNSGAATLRVVGVYVLGKGKPLATPAK